MKSFFAPRDVTSILGISYRQLQYWDKTNFIKPSYKRKGRFRLYTFTDLIYLWIVKRLSQEHHVSVQRLRRTIKSLRGLLPQVSAPRVEATVIFLKDPRDYPVPDKVLGQKDSLLVVTGEVQVSSNLRSREPLVKLVVFKIKELAELIEFYEQNN